MHAPREHAAGRAQADTVSSLHVHVQPVTLKDLQILNIGLLENELEQMHVFFVTFIAYCRQKLGPFSLKMLYNANTDEADGWMSCKCLRGLCVFLSVFSEIL